jgi:energy-coupling factor transporter ATP-binding protein EcfA2
MQKTPVLVLSAHRGSGKTAAAEILKGLIDPGKAGLIKLQGDTHKLAVAATRRHLMVYDNVSHITPDQSDDLCRISTGFGFSTRTLHTTDEETTFELTRPQIITAIDALVTRDDLADRVLMTQLPEIPADSRLPQAELNAKVEAARPRILGALLTALSQTLAQPRPDVELPRMADYALFAIASEKALGLEKGEFMKTFNQSREQSRQIVIESSPVGEAIVRLMENYPSPQSWKGTASELLKELEKHTDEATYRSRFFPKASNMLSRQLKRLTPDLRALGILISEKNIHGTKKLTLEKELKVSPLSPPNQSKPARSNNVEGGDRGGDKGGDTLRGGDTFQNFAPNSGIHSNFDVDRPINQNNCSGGDTCSGGDKGGDKKTVISTLQISSQQTIQDLGGDGGDKKTLFSKESSDFSEKS